jgi:EAL domain-containing protein (putative c-di-GMP-specific phosphodiesterase class I)
VVREAFARALERAGHTVDVAADGAAALESIRTQQYDAVVSDIAMPKLDGVRLLQAVRTEDLDLPVILATGEPTVETAVQAVALGAFRYLPKPLQPKQLVATVKRAVQQRRMSRVRRKLEQLGDQSWGTIGDLAGLQAHFDRALERVHMVYQPIIDWKPRKVVGYEALVRSTEPRLPHPGALFDAAERLDRLDDLGRAIRRCCAAAVAALPDGVALFVNLHTQDLLDETLYESDADLGPSADRIVFEITERAKLESVPDIAGRAARLRGLGYRLAIDDIGAGYAGLNSFAQLEPEVVKLDMALVRDVQGSVTKQKLIQALVTLCRDLGLAVVAEGVETVEERDALLGLGCDWFQGYLFARPAAAFAEPALDVE